VTLANSSACHIRSRWLYLLRKLFLKIWIHQNGENFIFLKKSDFTIGFTDPMFPIQCRTFVELRLHKMGDFFTKNRILRWNILNFGRLKGGLKIVGRKYQKAHPYAKSGAKSLGVCASSGVLTVCGAEKKSTRERLLESRVVYNTVSLFVTARLIGVTKQLHAKQWQWGTFCLSVNV